MESTTEIKKIISTVQNRYGYTLLEISRMVGVTEAALSRWKMGRSAPTFKNLLKLKGLIKGGGGEQEVKPPGAHSQEWLDGKFDQLTKQIADLQGALALTNQRVDLLEGQRGKGGSEKKREVHRTVHPHREEKAGRAVV